jgi:DNA-binding transcriptional ArsR family regulator
MEIRNFKKFADIGRSLYNNKRVALLRLIKEKPGITQTELILRSRVTQTEISMHLNKLQTTGVIYAKKQGTWKYYFIDMEVLTKIVNFPETIGV